MKFFKILKSRVWTNKTIRKNMKTTVPVDCEKYIHSLDKAALIALKKIPLLKHIV